MHAMLEKIKSISASPPMLVTLCWCQHVNPALQDELPGDVGTKVSSILEDSNGEDLS